MTMMLHVELGRPALIGWCDGVSPDGIVSDGEYVRMPADVDVRGWLANLSARGRDDQFLYIDAAAHVMSDETVRHIAARANRRWFVATSVTDNLRRLWSAGANQIRLVVHYDQIGSRGPACPYTGIEIPEPVVTHELVRSVHQSGKEIFVRLSTSGSVARRERRISWLRHEHVDALVCG